MEDHPIPQDITGFQFKLIGNMTIKQFAYLAAGAVLSWLFFILPIFFLIKFPFALFCAGFGAGLAFLPIEGRPMDVMITNFFKALLNPTQFIYQRTSGHLWFPENAKKTNEEKAETESRAASLSGKKLQEYLDSLPKQSTNKLDQKELQFFKNLSTAHPEIHALPALQANQSGALPIQSTLPAPQEPPNDPNLLQKDEGQEKVLTEETALLTQELTKAEAEEKKDEKNPSLHEKVISLQTQLQDMLGQKEKLEKELEALHRTLSQTLQASKPMQKVSSVSPTPAPQKQTPVQIPQAAQPVPKPIAPSLQKSTLPIPEFPNLVTGMVRDPRGNPLQNILVEIKDKDGSPARAFKTNGLGQFASATPLGNGDFTIDFEDPKGQSTFTPVSFKATGQVILPLEITSTDNREELRKSLFQVN